MTTDYILPLSDPRATLAVVGGKGASLARLAQAGLPVPGGFHITTAAYDRFVAANDLARRIWEGLEHVDAALPVTLEAASNAIRALFAQAVIPPDIADALRAAYAALDDGAAVVAVRSSATAEDLPDLSFAGQQDTFLNVRGLPDLLDKVKACWASLWTARAIGYRAQHAIDHQAVSLAVVVQTLVPAQAAGVLFTANPVTGARDQALLTAAWGLGEALVGGLVTPDTLTLEKATGRVLSRETADKQTMTVRLEAGTAEQPVPDALRRAPVLSDAQAAALTRLGNQIEQLYGMPMDIEWALAHERWAILQARPITALPPATAGTLAAAQEPERPAPTEWKLPRGAYAAMRNNIVELMADPLSPLFATLGRAAINASLHRIMNESFAMRGIMPDEIIIIVNQYAYNNGSLRPAGLARVLLGAGSITKAMFTGAVERWTGAARPRYCQTVESWRAKAWRSFSAMELLDSARQLTEAAIDAYAALLSGVIPAAWITEALFTALYDRLIKRRGDPAAPTFLLGYDSVPIRADKSLYRLAEWARGQPALRDYLDRTPTARLASLAEGAPAEVPPELWGAWRRRLQEHLDQFGHTLYDLDFAHPVPADDPAPVLDAFKHYLRGQGADPAQRQQESERRREQAVRAVTQRLRGWRLNLFNAWLARAQKFAPLREDGLAEIGLAYPLLRQMLRELGRRCAQAGVIAAADDIFWLTEAEVRRAAERLDAGEPAEPLAAHIPQRRAEHQAAQRVSPPLALPQMKVFGFDLMSLRARRGRGGRADVIKGVACSAGRVAGPARVLHGPEDFGQMKPGDVLVAPITTPAWTPLFALASAVVTDVGGPLSHGSIVAREYGIPSVLGTGVATHRIRSGQIVIVDGSAGTVTLTEKTEAPGSGPLDWQPPDPKGVYMRTGVVDLMPDPVSPLFASWGIPAMVAQMTPLGLRLTRVRPILHEDYFTTINSYGYMNAHFPARSWWWILTGLLPAYPRMLRILVPYWRDEARPGYQSVVDRWKDQAFEAAPARELWRGANEVVDAAMQYVCGLMFATMGASAGSEALLTRVYDRMAKRDGDPPATALLMGWDNIPARAEKSLYDLAQWARERPALAAHVLETPGAELAGQLRAGRAPGGVDAADWQELRQRFERHLEQFGYIIFELDFAKPLPQDDPASMLETVKMYLRGEGANPHERQQVSEARRRQTAETMLARLKGWKGWVFRQALNWAQSLSEVREDALADIGLGYPVLRRMLRELGGRLAAAGALAQADDIYWLERQEIETGLAQLDLGRAAQDLRERVAQRRNFWQTAKQTTPPPMIPMKKRYLGFNTDIWLAASESDQGQDTLKGVPASAGTVTAQACVIHGPEDFAQMKPGAVLVAGTTTPAWTPLFAMASAVVTDIGGPLSHGSIVAREYGIPAVMGTGVATKRIHTGQMITVDGGVGVVALSPETLSTQEQSDGNPRAQPAHAA